MVTVSFSKRDLVWFVPLVVIMIVGFGLAFGGTEPSVMGHSFGEIEFPVCVDGQILEYSGGSLICGSAGAGVKITSGTYKGTDVTNRPIAHGLGTTPDLVVIYSGGTKSPSAYAGAFLYYIRKDVAWIHDVRNGLFSPNKLSDSINFYVGTPEEDADWRHIADERTSSWQYTYYWIAYSF